MTEQNKLVPHKMLHAFENCSSFTFFIACLWKKSCLKYLVNSQDSCCFISSFFFGLKHFHPLNFLSFDSYYSQSVEPVPQEIEKQTKHTLQFSELFELSS